MRFRWAIITALFIVVPVLEIYVLIQIGQVIGAWWTVVLLLVDGVLGSMLVRHQGRRTWATLGEAVSEGRMPHRELADAAVVLVGGTLLMAPGFVTDFFGLFCVLPFTRPWARKVLTMALAQRTATLIGSAGVRVGDHVGGDSAARQRPGPDGVVQGEVVSDR